MEEEFVYGSTKAKIKLAAVMLSLFCLMLVIKYLWETFIPYPEEDSIEAINQYIKATSNASIYISSLLFFIYLYAAREAYLFGKRIIVSQQYPPPGAEMPFTMKISKGKKALRQGKASYITAGILVFTGLLKLGGSIYFSQVLTEFT